MAREREGERRRKEGLPRNYLLVDEHTKKPYGAGVGNWRKELMLLSRKLDPAVGQINKQPAHLVKEIAEWIQHTWEYSSPIQFEVVKEVIARGVCLRRAELWKRITRKEPKPEDVSDRTWRSLSRELDNPATKLKSQNCSRANAARVNFGRTGPSGEVGVREKLRRRLRRSPEPHEVHFEMARDKGYAGRSKRLRIDSNDMPGLGKGVAGGSGELLPNECCDTIDEGEDDIADEDRVGNGPGILNLSASRPEGSRINNIPQKTAGAFPIPDDQILTNPFVLKLMERIAALEKRTEIVNLHLQQHPPPEDNETDVTVLGGHVDNGVSRTVLPPNKEVSF